MESWWVNSTRKYRQRIRGIQINKKQNVRSLYIKHYRGNVWATAKFHISILRKVSKSRLFMKELSRSFGEASIPEVSHNIWPIKMHNEVYLNYQKKKHLNFCRKFFPRDVTKHKIFYRIFNDDNEFRRTRFLMFKRLQSFEGIFRVHQMRKIWRTGTIKGNPFSASLFVYRFMGRLSHYLFFGGYAVSRHFSFFLIRAGFVFVNNICIKDPLFLVPFFAIVRLILPPVFKHLYNFFFLYLSNFYCSFLF